jgi:hypothetical protein
MTKEQVAPNVIVPIEHQSAPKEHWMLDELRKAAEEIDSGRFKPKLADDDYFYYGEDQLLAAHPRIADALEKMKNEVQQSKNSQEFIEKSQMLHELNERVQQCDKWDGQGRWMGAENEEMRQGELLEPVKFMRRLWAVVGEDRVQINRFAVMGRVALLVDDPQAAEHQAIAMPPAIDYDRRIRAVESQGKGEGFAARMKRLEASFTAAESARYVPPDYLKGKCQVATLQWPLGTEWMVMRFNSYGVPTSPKYTGWRTALLSLITLGIITEGEAHKAFPVKGNPASLWYRAQLYQLRHGGQHDS